MNLEVVWFLFVAAMMLTIFVLGIRAWSRDRKRWALWARAREWQFFERWPEMVRAFRGGPFGRGSGRSAQLGFQGRFDGLPASGFRYRYTTGSGKNSTTHHYTVLRVQVPAARFPHLSLGHESWGTRTFGNDIQFEDADFNRQWHVKGANARFVHDVIHPRMMEFLKSGGIPALENLWFELDSVLVSFKGNLRPEQVDAYLRLLTRTIAHVPRFVLDEVAARRPELTWDGPGISAEEQAVRLSRLRQQK